MNPVARLRFVLARRPWLHWCAVALLAATGGWAAAAAMGGVEEARRAWGTTRDVVVATADVGPGEELAAATAVRARPVPVVPAAALAEVPAGAVARQHVAAGEVVVATDVAATSGPQALIPAGWAAVAVAEPVPSGAAAGDLVAAVSEGVVLAAEAVVVGRVGEATLVAVPLAEAPDVAAATAGGTLTLLLVP